MTTRNRIAPWFGAWPPKSRGKRMENQKSHFERYRLQYNLVLLILFGSLAATLFSHEGTLYFSFFEHVFLAIAVSAIIALTIEVALHQRFARNVFEAAIGYLLPEELRDELRWIYGMDCLCTSFVQTVRLDEIQNTDLIKAKTTVVRTIKNITDKPIKFPMGVGLDEWFHDGYPSKILSLSYQTEGHETQYPELKLEKGPSSLSVASGIFACVESQKHITIAFEIEETKTRTDMIFNVFGTPTLNPVVMVDAPDSIETSVRFDHREKHHISKQGNGGWRLEGILLPHQCIRVHWHDKNKSKAFQLE